MTDITFKFTRTWYNCECCGSYDGITLAVYKGDELLGDFYKDGHFGYGIDVENIEVMLPEIFKLFNMNAVVEVVDVD